MNYLEHFYQRAINWLVVYGPRIIIAIVVLLLAQLGLKLLRKWLKGFFDKSHIDPSIKTFLANLIIVVLQVLLFVILMQVVGVKMTLLLPLPPALL